MAGGYGTALFLTATVLVCLAVFSAADRLETSRHRRVSSVRSVDVREKSASRREVTSRRINARFSSPLDVRRQQSSVARVSSFDSKRSAATRRNTADSRRHRMPTRDVRAVPTRRLNQRERGTSTRGPREAEKRTRQVIRRELMPVRRSAKDLERMKRTRQVIRKELMQVRRSAKDLGRTRQVTVIRKEVMSVRRSAKDLERTRQIIRKEVMSVRRSAKDLERTRQEIRKEVMSVRRSAKALERTRQEIRKEVMQVRCSAKDFERTKQVIRKEVMPVRRSANDLERTRQVIHNEVMPVRRSAKDLERTRRSAVRQRQERERRDRRVADRRQISNHRRIDLFAAPEETIVHKQEMIRLSPGVKRDKSSTTVALKYRKMLGKEDGQLDLNWLSSAALLFSAFLLPTLFSTGKQVEHCF